jgi:hypothetical protein
MPRSEPRSVRVERLFDIARLRAAGAREIGTWRLRMKRAQRLKAMRDPAFVAAVDAARLEQARAA